MPFYKTFFPLFNSTVCMPLFFRIIPVSTRLLQNRFPKQNYVNKCTLPSNLHNSNSALKKQVLVPLSNVRLLYQNYQTYFSNFSRIWLLYFILDLMFLIWGNYVKILEYAMRLNVTRKCNIIFTSKH